MNGTSRMLKIQLNQNQPGFLPSLCHFDSFRNFLWDEFDLRWFTRLNQLRAEPNNVLAHLGNQAIAKVQVALFEATLTFSQLKNLSPLT